MMFCAGLTGGYAAGKTAAANIFAALGAKVIDADIVGRALTAPGGAALPLLQKTLGAWAFTAAGELDRAALRTRAFASPALRRRLENALHPQIEKEMRRQMAEPSAAPYLLLSVPLLFESGRFLADCCRTVAVDCARQTQIARAAKRDGVSTAAARAVIAAQMPRRARLARADDIICNDGGRGALRRAVVALHKKYMQYASERKNR
ncbi:MAG: dephospho-CoA kinase [Gammaproteobacteria bacterium]